MITIRRFYLDKFMNENNSLFQGKILDIGGVRGNSRGKFKHKTFHEKNRVIINNNKKANPDFLLSIEEKLNLNLKFDTVIVNELIEYVENIENLFDNIIDLTKKDSILIMSWPWMNTFHGDRDKDLKRYSKVYIESLLIKNGFRIKYVGNNGGLFSVLWDFLHTLNMNCRNSLVRKIFKILLSFSFYLSLFLDKIIKTSEFVTTGFTLVATRVK